MTRRRKWPIAALVDEWMSTGVVSSGIMFVSEHPGNAGQDIHRTIVIAVQLTDVYNVQPLLVGGHVVFNQRLYNLSSSFSVVA